MAQELTFNVSFSTSSFRYDDFVLNWFSNIGMVALPYLLVRVKFSNINHLQALRFRLRRSNRILTYDGGSHCKEIENFLFLQQISLQIGDFSEQGCFLVWENSRQIMSIIKVSHQYTCLFCQSILEAAGGSLQRSDLKEQNNSDKNNCLDWVVSVVEINPYQLKRSHLEDIDQIL